MEYVVHIAIMLNIYIMLAMSTNITVGMANLFTLCQAAFYGIGAYAGTFILLRLNLPILAVAAIVMLFTGVMSLLVSFASIKLKGDYFVLATLGFQMITYTILYNWIKVTNGPYGISAIPQFKLLGLWDISGVYAYFVLSLVMMLVVVLLFNNLRKSPYGRVLKAMRYDESYVSAVGRNTTMLKTWAFFISAAFASLAGLLYASYVSYIDPTSFTLNESIFIVSALFIGGAGNVKGPIIGAVFVVLLPELLRFVGLPDTIASNLRQIIYGLTMIMFMYFRPQGICGEKQA